MAGYYRVARALLELEVAQKEWEAKRNHESKSFGVQFCISRSARPRLLDLISQALQKWAPSRAGAERIDSRSCFGLSACTGFHVAPVNRGRTSGIFSVGAGVVREHVRRLLGIALLRIRLFQHSEAGALWPQSHKLRPR